LKIIGVPTAWHVADLRLGQGEKWPFSSLRGEDRAMTGGASNLGSRDGGPDIDEYAVMLAR
jgi:hypothetical protein